MRTITNLHDLYLAFAELHSCCAILNSGERTEYNLGDGHIAYLTCDEREFLDAIKKLETKTGETTEVPVLTRNPDLDITGGLCQTIADSTRAMHPGVDTTKPLTLFTAYTLLKRRGITGKNRKRPPSEDTAKAVEVVSTSIEKAVNSVLKKCKKDYLSDLNKYQLEKTYEYAVEFVWDALGDRFEKALSHAASKLACSANEDAFDLFLYNFMRVHARCACRDYGRCIFYVEVRQFDMPSMENEYPEQFNTLTTDLKYGEGIGCQDAIALQLSLLNMCRLLPDSAKVALGPYNSGCRSAIIKAILRREVDDGELDHLYGEHFGILDNAITAGTDRAMRFLKAGNFFAGDSSGHRLLNAYHETLIRDDVRRRVRMALVCLNDNDLSNVLKDIDEMRARDKFHAHKRYPCGIVMQHVRLAMHETIWSMRQRDKHNI